MAFTYKQKKWRDRIVADYLASTQRDQFDPDEFLTWLKDQPDHVAHPIFYGEDSEPAAPHSRVEYIDRRRGAIDGRTGARMNNDG